MISQLASLRVWWAPAPKLSAMVASQSLPPRVCFSFRTGAAALLSRTPPRLSEISDGKNVLDLYITLGQIEDLQLTRMPPLPQHLCQGSGFMRKPANALLQSAVVLVCMHGCSCPAVSGGEDYWLPDSGSQCRVLERDPEMARLILATNRFGTFFWSRINPRAGLFDFFPS